MSRYQSDFLWTEQMTKSIFPFVKADDTGCSTGVELYTIAADNVGATTLRTAVKLDCGACKVACDEPSVVVSRRSVSPLDFTHSTSETDGFF